jgi:transcriptional regulator with XRE-family HTH domain
MYRDLMGADFGGSKKHSKRVIMGTPRVEHRKDFVRRLVAACNESKLIPGHGQGRQRMIAERMDVSQETVSKWFKGVSLPDPETLEKLADLLEVDLSWLALGVKAQSYTSPEQRRVQASQSNGAVHLVWGMFELEGARCGLPDKKDSRAAYVDFYVGLRGTTTPINVSLGRLVSDGVYELALPREYDEVRCIGVLRLATKSSTPKYCFLDLLETLIHEHKQTKKGPPIVQVNCVEKGVYKTGAGKWPEVKFAGDG